LPRSYAKLDSNRIHHKNRFWLKFKGSYKYRKEPHPAIQPGFRYPGLGTAYVYRGNFERTEHYAAKAIEYLEGTSEERALAIANIVLGACYIGRAYGRSQSHGF